MSTSPNTGAMTALMKDEWFSPSLSELNKPRRVLPSYSLSPDWEKA